MADSSKSRAEVRSRRDPAAGIPGNVTAGLR
jgi:hypothetical protein